MCDICHYDFVTSRGIYCRNLEICDIIVSEGGMEIVHLPVRDGNNAYIFLRFV